MKKNKLKHVIPLLLSGGLSKDKAIQLHEAIKEDPSLEKDLGEYKDIISELKDIDVPMEREGFSTRLKASVQEEIGQNSFTVLQPKFALAASIILLFVVSLSWFYFSPSKVERLEQWIVENVESYENSTDYSSLSWEYLDETELEYFETELASSEGVQQNESMYSSSPAGIFKWEFFLRDEEVADTILQNNLINGGLK